MNMYQSRYIPSSNPWEPSFLGAFFHNGYVPCFLYKEKQDVCLLPLTCDVPTAIHVDLGNEVLPLPFGWIMLEYCGRPFLFVKPNIAIDLLQEKQLSFVPEPLREEYITHARPEMYFEKHQFCFDDYCISHKGNCGYHCTKAGEAIWEFIGKAYLYTDICRWNDRVYFGTAGRGGYLYVLDINTGDPIASIKTGGTACIAQMGHLCFVTSKSKKQNSSILLCLDLRDGSVVHELALHGGVTENSKLQIIGQQLHIVTFENRGDQLQNAIWNIVNI